MTRTSFQQAIYIRKNTSSGKRKWIKIGTLTSRGAKIDLTEQEMYALVNSDDGIGYNLKPIYKRFGLLD